MQLPDQYNIKETEEKWQKYWEKEKIYKFDEKSKKEIFSIDTPPPYVSAEHLHVGHGMSYSQAEFIARYKRMKGYNVFYPMGFDDNGLPTERFVEKKYNINKSKISREEFIKLCLKETEIGGKNYRQLWTKLGISVDWSLLYSTINNLSRKIAQRSFIDLYSKNRVERRNDPITWCVHCQTSLAQADLEDLEEESYLNEVYFIKGDKKLTISTTRPELIPACVALAYNPKDIRYKELKGKKAKVPLFNYEVPILEDENVDIKYGSGLLMVCTFGDIEDIEKWRKHKLDIRLIIEKNGKLNDLAGKYKGLKPRDARKEIIEDLKKEKLLGKQIKIKHTLNVHERCSTPIEFYLAPQWYIKLLDLKKELVNHGKKVNWNPKYMFTRYEHWVNNLKWDWWISRERFYGVPFPVWYCKKCNAINLAEDKYLPVDPSKDKPSKKCSCGSQDFIPETDVMDTWMTSSLTPLINAKWNEKNNLMNKIYPMNLRPQAHDIIRTWAFYTITKSYLHTNKIPWNDIMISGHGLDSKGQKFSKSKGNMITIEEVTNKYGADSFRFLSASNKLGEDALYNEKDLTTGKRTVTKLFNASKLVLINIKDYKNQVPDKLELVDSWLLSKLNDVVKNCTEAFDNYEYNKAKSELDNFFWNIFCDYYLEIVKSRLYNENLKGKEAKISAQYTLNHSLLTILKLFAPIMPHITEEIYHYNYAKKEKLKSIHLSSWPKYDKKLENKNAEETCDLMINIIKEVRTFKTKNNKSLKEEVELTLEKNVHQKLQHVLADLKSVCNAKNINFGSKFEVKF